MTSVRKRIAESTADDHNDATTHNQDTDNKSALEIPPAKRCDQAGKLALIWPWRATPGQHVRPIVLEAVEILKSEGWVIGRILDPVIPFDLMGIRKKACIFVKAVKAKYPVANAKEAVNTYGEDIRKMQPFWHSDDENLQFWIFSRVAGLLRYRVYRGGIWNEATRKKPDSQELRLEAVSHRMRSAS